MDPPGAVVNVLKSTEGSGGGFRESVCLPFLRQAQNADGGWGYHAGTSSAVEATAWCLLGLAKTDAAAEGIERGKRWLAGAQLGDGSWPTRPETLQGNWVTALVGLALLATGGPLPAVASAARWVCRSRSARGGLRWRLLQLMHGKKVVEQDVALRGWSWTPGTAGWVEPTSVALLFLHALPAELVPSGSGERRQMGEAMLYDRMCPDGGWNSGNPKIYGVAGVPQIGPTAWALLALQEQAAKAEIQRSLDWLSSEFDAIDGPSSLALAYLALDAAGRSAQGFESKLAGHFETGDFLGSVMAFAQAAYALSPGPDLLRWAPARE
ncbi:MAG TPA: prenyltransferase/squalene oxidase repeat-containing protein [Patescibacteria group bacterium]|nr:prenyltransferase/squalene oxidase repeat-containing protein [Patescibacteria group bacterium]